MSAPVVSSDLYGYEQQLMEERVDELVQPVVADLGDRVKGALAVTIRDAYLDGLRDGFAQGVAAAHNGAEDHA